MEFDTLPSTNLYALDLLSSKHPPEGTAVITAHQTAGRGQMGTTWESNREENLTVSIIFRPVFLPVKKQFQLNKSISLAIFQLVNEYFPGRVSIKWPNDILVDERKICGILIQNGVQGKRLQWSVVGLGINVNQRLFGEHLDRATSFIREGGVWVDLKDLRNQLFAKLDYAYQQLRSNDKSLDELYLNALYRLGIPTNFTLLNGETFMGVIRQVDDIGRLVIEDQSLEKRHFNLKEISYQ